MTMGPGQSKRNAYISMMQPQYSSTLNNTVNNTVDTSEQTLVINNSTTVQNILLDSKRSDKNYNTLLTQSQSSKDSKPSEANSGRLDHATAVFQLPQGRMSNSVLQSSNSYEMKHLKRERTSTSFNFLDSKESTINDIKRDYRDTRQLNMMNAIEEHS